MRLEDLKILVEPSEYRHLNIGDAAMLTVAVDRLRAIAPAATIQVLTDAPDRLAALCPGVVPIPARGRRAWVHTWTGRAPAPVRPWLRRTLLQVRRRFPWATRRAVGAAMLIRHRSAAALRQYLSAATQSDLVVLSGMGAINDEFPDHAWGLLETLELAIESGAVTALMGQGIGPVRDEQLRARLSAILPGADLIALREGRSGPEFLQEIGVPAERVIVTGDDAIETAYSLRGEKTGTALGVNVRVAPYSGITAAAARAVAAAVEPLVAARSAPLVPLPVSRYEDSDDRAAIAQMFAGRSVEETTITTVPDLVGAITRCRVVVAASYHAAVFSLSVGVPVVAIVSSDYYRMKFDGLRDLFGAGCIVVDLGREEGARDVGVAVERLWDGAEELRPALLEAARVQIEKGHDAYRRLGALVRERKGSLQFNLHDQQAPTWYDRAEKCVSLLDLLASRLGTPDLRIADIGSGDRKLKAALQGRAFPYDSFDLLPQSGETRRYDVRAEPLPAGYEVAVLLGVTEYIENLESTLGRLSGEVPHLIVSHTVRADRGGTGRNPRWKTHLSVREMESLLERCQFAVVESRVTADGATRLWLCDSRSFGRASSVPGTA
jgi:polysaccharide pyruvyl transferase WcaK-like protein